MNPHFDSNRLLGQHKDHGSLSFKSGLYSIMGGRFGKYGDLKRRKALQRGRREKSKLERAKLSSLGSRSGLLAPKQRSSSPYAARSYKTAVVIIPPDHLWGPIQGLRKQYDRNYRRWMPHITLLYPFRAVSAFEQVIPALAQACRSLDPFGVQLNRFDLFWSLTPKRHYLSGP